jgi:hypothetical protein
VVGVTARKKERWHVDGVTYFDTDIEGAKARDVYVIRNGLTKPLIEKLVKNGMERCC